MLLHVIDSSRADGGAAQREAVVSVLRRLGVSDGRLRHGVVEARNKIDLLRASAASAAEEISGREEEDDAFQRLSEAGEASTTAPADSKPARGRGGRGGSGGARGLYLPPFDVGVSAVTGQGLELLGWAIESVAMLRGRTGEGCWLDRGEAGATRRGKRTSPCLLCSQPKGLEARFNF